MLEPQVYRGVGTPVAPPVSDEPAIEIAESTEGFARIVAAPLPPGFGITLGNALRRALLSSLNGAAVLVFGLLPGGLMALCRDAIVKALTT